MQSQRWICSKLSARYYIVPLMTFHILTGCTDAPIGSKLYSEALLSDIHVYVLADYLDVDGLKVQALANCTHHLGHHFDPATFFEPISVALANTKADDTGLRRQILRSCVQFSGAVAKVPDL